MDSLWTDLRYAVRTLRQNLAFTLAAVSMLALGIGVNAIVFSVTNAALLKGFPLVADNDRLLYISNNGKCCVSYPDFSDWREQTTTFDDMALVHGLGITLADEAGFPENYTVTEVTANTFGLVRQRPILGRDFTAADEKPGATPVVILRYSFWETRFAKDPVRLPYEIDGVPIPVGAERPIVGRLLISPSYFRTLGQPLVAGRDVTELDEQSGVPVVLVNGHLRDCHDRAGAVGGTRLLDSGTARDETRSARRAETAITSLDKSPMGLPARDADSAGREAHAARTLSLPPRVGVIPATTIAACTGGDRSHDMDRATRTRGVESLHSLSGLVHRRAPTASRSGRPTGDVIQCSESQTRFGCRCGLATRACRVADACEHAEHTASASLRHCGPP